jgi:16S rRNA (guanine966-N2)-methyltransferase
MRIVGGKFRGRVLQAPKSQDIRPTSDRIRESLFNVISHNYSEYLENTRVLDLFAGTGALGIEALSRGARFTLFIENSVEGRGLLRQNIENLSLQGHSKVFRRDATDLGPIGSMIPFDLVFADPPYGRGFGEKAAAGLIAGGWLSPSGLLVLEENRDIAPENLPGFELLEKKSYAGTKIGIFRLNNT